MAITRRDFLKYSAAVGGGLLLGIGIFDLKPIVAYASASPPLWTAEATSVCGYCSVGCSMIVGKGALPNYTGDYVTYVQGNPDSPINKGALCSKGSASAQFSTIVQQGTGVYTYTEYTRIPTPGRLTTVHYRDGSSATTWTSTNYDYTTAINDIALLVKGTRDTTFTATESVDGSPLTVNRCRGIATLGGSSLNNETAYLITKLNRALGVVYLETQARN